MNILLTNDDGVLSDGLQKLGEALCMVADVYVCAPDEQKSASSHSVTINRVFTINETNCPYAVLAYEINGTPADCVKVGLRVLNDKGVDIDMVFSGINHGSNIGTDTIYSGTVAAAREGNLCGVPAVALSVDSYSPEYYDMAMSLAKKTVRRVYGRLDSMTLLNINVPDLPEKDIQGIRYTRLSTMEHREWLQQVIGSDGVKQYEYAGTPVKWQGMPDDIDVVAIKEGYASITPMQYDMTAHELIKEVEEWRIDK